MGGLGLGPLAAGAPPSLAPLPSARSPKAFRLVAPWVGLVVPKEAAAFSVSAGFEVTSGLSAAEPPFAVRMELTMALAADRVRVGWGGMIAR